MKPMLTLDMILGGGAGHAAPEPGRAPSDDLEHRLLQIVWANGEGLDAAVPTRGTALLQHGFKEWSAARGITPIGPDPAAVLQAVRICHDENWTPLVLCRDLVLPLHVLAHLMACGPTALMALGAPLGLRLSPRRADLHGALFPIRPPAGVDPGQCLWLGAPEGLVRPALGLPGGLRVPGRELRGQALKHHLQDAETHLCALGPAHLWCLLFLDDVALSDATADSDEGVPPEALAATLRWLQRQLPSVFVFMVSHERVTPPQRGRIAELARHLGGALHRHTGVRREAFAAPAQKKR
jgi:hypothetical protein